MARRTVLAGGLGVLLTLGCSPPAAPRATVSPPPTTRAVAAVRPPVLTDWREVSYPQTPSHVLLMGSEPDGTHLVAVDGFRMKQRGEQVEVAKQALYAAIFRSCRAGAGWVHVSDERDVYRSDTFLGKMEVVGHVDNIDFLQCGPQAVTLRPRPVFWSDVGAQRLTWDSPISWASFSDRKHGEALAFPDFWLKTSDGGKTFARTAASMSIADAFARVPPTEHALLSDAEFALVLRAWSRRALRSVAGRAVAGAQLADGSVFRTTGTRNQLWIEVRTAQGKFSSLEVSGNCTHFDAWGGKLAVLCFTDPGEERSELKIAYPTKETLPGPPLPPQHGFIADAEGRYLFAQGRMIDHPRQKTRPLMRFDGKAWQVYEHIDSPPVVVQRGWLLLDNPPRAVPAEHPEQDALLLPAANLDVDLQEAAVLEHGIVYVRRAHDGSKAELVEVELGSGRELKVVPLSTATLARLPPELRCTTSSCGTTPTTAWTRLPDEDEPELLPTPPRHDYLSESVDVDPGFTLRDYDCELVANVGHKDQELRGLLPIPGNDRQRIVAIPGIGGVLDLGAVDAPAVLAWHGVDSIGAFAVTTPASPAVAELKAQLPRSTEDAPTSMPALVSRQFVLVNEQVGPELQHRLRLLDKDGHVRELVPTGDFEFLVVPLADGRSLLSVERDLYREVMVLASDGRVGQHRHFVINYDFRDHPAVRAGVPGLVSLADGQAAFFSLERETPGIPVTIAEQRALEPCRKKPSADALWLFVDNETDPDQRFSIAGVPSMTGSARNRETVVVVESTPKASCLRGALLDDPSSTELFSSGPWLQGRVQGQTKTHKLVCRSPVRPAPPATD